MDGFLCNELFVKGYACKRGANYNELFPFTKVWFFIQYPLYFDTTHIHTSLLIPALKDSKCVFKDRKDIRFLWSGCGFGLGFFEKRIFTEKCSKVNYKGFAIFTDFFINPWDPNNVEESCTMG